MRKALLVGGVVAAALTIAAPANAGCWATVGLGPPAEGTAAGDTWTAQLTVLQHGRTPLADAKPTLTIVNTSTGARKTFPAHATDPAEGRYEANVVFPSGGRWTYEVYDGFTTMDGMAVPCARTHTFAAVEIDGASGAAGGGSDDSGGGFALWPFVAGLGVAGAAALALLYRRRQGRAPAAA